MPRRLLSTQANVEDSAEATIRIYDLIAGVPNVEIPEEEWSTMDFDEEELSDEELEQLLDQLRSEPIFAESSSDDHEEAYESPPQVDYRGRLQARAQPAYVKSPHAAGHGQQSAGGA